jgi:hypothetical protein
LGFPETILKIAQVLNRSWLNLSQGHGTPKLGQGELEDHSHLDVGEFIVYAGHVGGARRGRRAAVTRRGVGKVVEGSGEKRDEQISQLEVHRSLLLYMMRVILKYPYCSA